MGHPFSKFSLSAAAPTVIQSSQETTVVCHTCNTKINTLLKTPNGHICPGCYKRIYINPALTQRKLTNAA